MKVTKFLIIFLFCALDSVFAATECYQCSSVTKPECTDLSDVTKLDKCQTTTSDDINCLHYIYQLNRNNITYRGCRKKSDSCEDVKNAIEIEKKVFVDCQLCGSNLCSSSVKINSYTLLNILFFVLLKKIIH